MLPTIQVEAADRIEQLETALREIEVASRDDWPALQGDEGHSESQHYSWIQDTAKEALKKVGCG